MESDCSVPERLVEVVAQIINLSLWFMLMLMPLIFSVFFGTARVIIS